jgi:hypothetical protein
MILEALALGALAAASLSDAEKARAMILAKLGRWKDVFDSIGPDRFASMVHRMPPGEPRDHAAKVFQKHYWQARVGDYEDSAKEAKSKAALFTSHWEGRWIPVISNPAPGTPGARSEVRAAAYDSEGRDLGGGYEDLDFPHAMMIKLGDGEVEYEWGSKVDTIFKIDEMESPIPDQGTGDQDVVWMEFHVYGPEFTVEIPF